MKRSWRLATFEGEIVKDLRNSDRSVRVVSWWYAGVVWLGEWVPQMQRPGGPWQRGQQGAWANLKLQICKGGGGD